MWKELYKTLRGSGGSCVKSDKLPQVMSPKAALVGAEDNKVENEKNLLVRR